MLILLIRMGMRGPWIPTDEILGFKDHPGPQILPRGRRYYCARLWIPISCPGFSVSTSE